MKIKLLGLAAAMTGLMIVACGDSGTSSTGSGGGDQGGGGGGDTTGSNGSTTSTSGDGGGGGGMGALCEADCAGDPGCAMDPADPGDACGMCLQQAATDLDECVTGPLLDPGGPCASDQQCSDFVDCELAEPENMPDMCETDHPEGYALSVAIVAQSCGACGDGTP